MVNKTFRRAQTYVRNGYGVETKPEHLAEFFPAYDRNTRTQILNDMDDANESFDGQTMRDTADNMALRFKLEEVHQALIKANR